MSPQERLAKLEELKKLRSEYRLLTYKPYAKQMAFHHMLNTERALFGGNRLGKTMCAGMETAMHLTGFYPPWWKGKRFNKAVRFGVGSETGDLLKKGPQKMLCGPMEAIGSGVIPKELLVWPPRMARNVPDGIDTLQVRHCTNDEPDGTLSAAVFMSYADGREKWQSDEWDGAWFDEEPPLDIYIEGLTRTNTTMGPVYLTMTPLKGMSDVALRYVERKSDCEYVTMGILDAEHYTRLSKEDQQKWIERYPEYERDMRLYGLPQPGEGKIFKHDEDLLKCDAFEIPRHFAIIGGMDFGIDHPFAAVKIAHDRDIDVMYLTNTYRVRGLTPVQHASALKRWGAISWAWPHDGLQRDKQSGKQLAQFYRDEGLGLVSEHAQYPDDRGNGVNASILDLDQRMGSGRFKVFRHLTDWFDEYRFYHRIIKKTDDGGQISVPIKMRDDLLSATRYGTMMLRYAEVETPLPKSDRYRIDRHVRRSWMAA